MLVIFMCGKNNFGADSAGPVESASGEFGSQVSTRGAIKLDGIIALLKSRN